MNDYTDIQGYTVETGMISDIQRYMGYGLTAREAVAVSHFYYKDDELSKMMRVAPEEVSDIREEGFRKLREWETANTDKVYHLDDSYLYTPGPEEMYRKIQARNAEEAEKRQKSWLYRHFGILIGDYTR